MLICESDCVVRFMAIDLVAHLDSSSLLFFPWAAGTLQAVSTALRATGYGSPRLYTLAHS
jgi:hypothetical protein